MGHEDQAATPSGHHDHPELALLAAEIAAVEGRSGVAIDTVRADAFRAVEELRAELANRGTVEAAIEAAQSAEAAASSAAASAAEAAGAAVEAEAEVEELAEEPEPEPEPVEDEMTPPEVEHKPKEPKEPAAKSMWDRYGK